MVPQHQQVYIFWEPLGRAIIQLRKSGVTSCSCQVTQTESNGTPFLYYTLLLGSSWCLDHFFARLVALRSRLLLSGDTNPLREIQAPDKPDWFIQARVWSHPRSCHGWRSPYFGSRHLRLLTEPCAPYAGLLFGRVVHECAGCYRTCRG